MVVDNLDEDVLPIPIVKKVFPTETIGTLVNAVPTLILVAV